MSELKVVQSHPWDQLDGETGPAYKAFLIYRDLGSERTLSDACRKGVKNRRQRRSERGPDERRPEWYQKHHWHQRALAWDRERPIRLHLKEEVVEDLHVPLPSILRCCVSSPHGADIV